MTDHLIWLGSYSSSDPKVAMLLTAYHIANMLPLVFDAEDTGDWKAEIMLGLHEAASRLQQSRFMANNQRVFEQRLAPGKGEVMVYGWVEIDS